MNTYGDMVTLLLCFFVLLYSISTVDESKWINLVKSLNPDAKNVSQVITKDIQSQGTENIPGINDTQIDQKFDELYDNLLEMQKASGQTMDIQVMKGDGYQFIAFKDKVFFDGDSYVLRSEGKGLLDSFSKALSPAADAIKEIQVLGHTTQADPKVPNEIVSDRVLSASRSAVVVAFIQQKNMIPPKKLVSAGYGQFRPIAPFDTEANRSKNRRVEILITKTGSVEKSLEEYYNQIYKTDSK